MDFWVPFFRQHDVTGLGETWPSFIVEKWERNEIGEERFTRETRVYGGLDVAWAEAEAALPEGGYLSLSGPNNEHHYNVAAFSGHTEHVESGDDHPWLTVNGGAIDVALPIGRGYGDTPAAAIRALVREE